MYWYCGLARASVRGLDWTNTSSKPSLESCVVTAAASASAEGGGAERENRDDGFCCEASRCWAITVRKKLRFSRRSSWRRSTIWRVGAYTHVSEKEDAVASRVRFSGSHCSSCLFDGKSGCGEPRRLGEQKDKGNGKGRQGGDDQRVGGPSRAGLRIQPFGYARQAAMTVAAQREHERVSESALDEKR